MTKTITTPNMLEISYLLDRHHQITNIGIQAGWPYGIEELAVTLEGENIDLDHLNFLRHGESIKLTSLPVVFDSIMIQVWRKVQDGSIDLPPKAGKS